jgi:hypothetical protein
LPPQGLSPQARTIESGDQKVERGTQCSNREFDPTVEKESSMTEINEIAFSTEELQQLPEDERNFILAASFIMNDIRFHWAHLARSPIDASDLHLGRMQVIRQLWGARKLASVIIEADATIGIFIGKIGFLKLYVNGSPIFSKENRKSKFWELARKLRTETAYHYLPKNFGQNLSGFSKSEVHRHYAHTQHGNSICTIGEQIFTSPLILGGLGENGLNEFCGWVEESSNLILDFCNNALGIILSKRLPHKSYLPIRIENLETSSASNRWPLFLEV